MTGQKISYHCFNCATSTGWSPGVPMSKKYRALAQSLGADDKEIHRVMLLLMEFNEFQADNDDYVPEYSIYKTLKLPKHVDVQDLPDDNPIKEYAVSRDILGIYPCVYFTEEEYYEERLVIPFTYEGRVVGWVGRHINPPNKATPKYMVETQTGYVFNVDPFLTGDREIVVVCEGIVDAIAVDGISVIGNTLTAEQALQIERLEKRVIVCPDRNTAGKELIEQATALGWEVSFPPWSNDIVDAADAAAKYGRLATLSSIIKYATANPVKIKVQTQIMETNVNN